MGKCERKCTLSTERGGGGRGGEVRPLLGGRGTLCLFF